MENTDETAHQALAAISRLLDTLTKMHPQAAEIVTGQVAIEQELWLFLRSKFDNPDQLPNLKVSHVLRLLEATTTDGWTLLVLNAATAFTMVRNAIAHADNQPNLDKAIARLCDAMGAIGSRPDANTARFGTIALAIIAALHVAFEGRVAGGGPQGESEGDQ